MQLHFYVGKRSDIVLNLEYLRALESCVYPRDQVAGAAMHHLFLLLFAESDAGNYLQIQNCAAF